MRTINLKTDINKLEYIVHSDKFSIENKKAIMTLYRRGIISFICYYRFIKNDDSEKARIFVLNLISSLCLDEFKLVLKEYESIIDMLHVNNNEWVDHLMYSQSLLLSSGVKTTNRMLADIVIKFIENVTKELKPSYELTSKYKQIQF